jgi:hypothetical protein
MPATSEKQRKFMGAQLAKQRSTGSNSTGMSETQLSDFARKGSSVKKAKHQKDGRSIVDVEFHRRAPETKTLLGSAKPHPIHAGYDHCVYGTDMTKFQDGKASTPGNTSALRDIGNGIHMGAEVEFYGPDTDFRTEEINPHHYGRDYEPAPLKDLFKTEEKAEELGIRMREEYEYQEIATPGSVAASGLPSSMAWGSVSYESVDTDYPDNRSFDSQMKYRRSHDEEDEDVPKVKDLKKY